MTDDRVYAAGAGEKMTALFVADGDSGAAGIGIFLIVVFVGGLYFLPSIVAASRRVPNVGSVIILNLFLGWTFIGWVISMSMAMRSRAQATIINVHNGVTHPGAAMPTAVASPAGWYPDPDGTADRRYWDGSRWTAHTA